MWTHLIRLGQHTFEVTANCQAAALRMLRQQYDPNYEQECFVVNQRYVYGVPVPAISARSRTDELPRPAPPRNTIEIVFCLRRNRLC
jgi:hypothetical protein